MYRVYIPVGRLDWRGKSEVATNRKWARVKLERIGRPWEGGRVYIIAVQEGLLFLVGWLSLLFKFLKKWLSWFAEIEATISVHVICMNRYCPHISPWTPNLTEEQVWEAPSKRVELCRTYSSTFTVVKPVTFRTKWNTVLKWTKGMLRRKNTILFAFEKDNRRMTACDFHEWMDLHAQPTVKLSLQRSRTEE
jgi:hypothetical protein